MVSSRALATGLLVASFGSLLAERSRRHVWLLGGGEAGEDGAGWYQEGVWMQKANLSEQGGTSVLETL